jgi:broad specificity phosphatase PhoE
MGQILLVRHGQASWGADDYDVLSELGETQAAIVGRLLAGLAPDRVVHGTMKRQQRSAEIASAAAGWSVDARTDERWNEIDHVGVLAAHPQNFEGSPNDEQFEAWFTGATIRWASGEFDHEYAESFAGFRARVLDALTEVSAAGTVVVFTSGGPISSVVAHLLAAGLDSYNRLAAAVANTSITRISSDGGRLSLVSFNEHAHLPPELLTHR